MPKNEIETTEVKSTDELIEYVVREEAARGTKSFDIIGDFKTLNKMCNAVISRDADGIPRPRQSIVHWRKLPATPWLMAKSFTGRCGITFHFITELGHQLNGTGAFVIDYYADEKEAVPA